MTTTETTTGAETMTQTIETLRRIAEIRQHNREVAWARYLGDHSFDPRRTEDLYRAFRKAERKEREAWKAHREASQVRFSAKGGA